MHKLVRNVGIGAVMFAAVGGTLVAAYGMGKGADINANLPSHGMPAQICSLTPASLVQTAVATVNPVDVNCSQHRKPFYPINAMVIEEGIKVGDRVVLVTGESGSGAYDYQFAVTPKRLGHR